MATRMRSRGRLAPALKLILFLFAVTELVNSDTSFSFSLHTLSHVEGLTLKKLQLTGSSKVSPAPMTPPHESEKHPMSGTISKVETSSQPSQPSTLSSTSSGDKNEDDRLSRSAILADKRANTAHTNATLRKLRSMRQWFHGAERPTYHFRFVPQDCLVGTKEFEWEDKFNDNSNDFRIIKDVSAQDRWLTPADLLNSGGSLKDPLNAKRYYIAYKGQVSSSYTIEGDLGPVYKYRGKPIEWRLEKVYFYKYPFGVGHKAKIKIPVFVSNSENSKY